MNIDTGTLAASIAALNVLFTVGGGFYFMGRVTGRLDAHEANTMRMEASLDNLRTLLVSSAVEADRLKRAENDIQNLENTVEGLRRGVGWVKDSNAQTVDRQY